MTMRILNYHCTSYATKGPCLRTKAVADLVQGYILAYLLEWYSKCMEGGGSISLH